MCGRFSQVMGSDILTDRFGIHEISDEIIPRYNIGPMSMVPVIFLHDDRRFLKKMKWGFVPFWSKKLDIGNKMINARSESILENKSFSRSFKNQRCVVPVSGFYEWKKIGTRKLPFHIRLKSKEPFGLAGIFSDWEGDDGNITTFSILTTEPNDLIESIHKRMPVILAKKYERTWLAKNSEISMVQNYLKPYPSEFMEAYMVSSIVNNPINESAKCIEPVSDIEDVWKTQDDEDQSSLNDFF